jgi:hypothetical protein
VCEGQFEAEGGRCRRTQSKTRVASKLCIKRGNHRLYEDTLVVYLTPSSKVLLMVVLLMVYRRFIVVLIITTKCLGFFFFRKTYDILHSHYFSTRIFLQERLIRIEDLESAYAIDIRELILTSQCTQSQKARSEAAVRPVQQSEQVYGLRRTWNK